MDLYEENDTPFPPSTTRQPLRQRLSELVNNSRFYMFNDLYDFLSHQSYFVLNLTELFKKVCEQTFRWELTEVTPKKGGNTNTNMN